MNTRHPTITIILDEDYVWRPTDSRGRLRKDARYELPVYGEVDIAYTSDEDYWVQEVRLTVSNGKMGAACVSSDEPIDSDHPLFAAVEKYLVEIRDADIVNMICEDIGERHAADLDARDEYRLEQWREFRAGLHQ